MREQIRNWLETLNWAWLRGVTHLRMWQSLTELLPRNRDASEMAATFWELTVSAHLDWSVLSAARFFDRSRDSVAMMTLLDSVERYARSLPESGGLRLIWEAVGDKTEVERLAGLALAVKKVRDRHYAHLDRRNAADPQKFLADNPIREEDLEEIYKGVRSLLDRYGAWFRVRPPDYDIIGGKHTKLSVEGMLDLLDKSLQAASENDEDRIASRLDELYDLGERDLAVRRISKVSDKHGTPPQAPHRARQDRHRAADCGDGQAD
jgi:hypothetical protein